jgi:hypothetical protein
MASGGRITFTPSDQVKLYLNELRKMGIYGKKRGDVINAILGKEIMNLLRDKILKRLPPDLEGADVDEEDEES